MIAPVVFQWSAIQYQFGIVFSALGEIFVLLVKGMVESVNSFGTVIFG